MHKEAERKTLSKAERKYTFSCRFVMRIRAQIRSKNGRESTDKRIVRII